ncbi:phage portal protein, partial [Paracoccus salipaludis]
MSLLRRIFGAKTEARSSSTWDRMRDGYEVQDMPLTPPLAENLSGVFACVQIISETIASLPLLVYR